MCTAIFGASAMMVASTLAIENPASRIFPPTSRRNTRLSAFLYLGSLSGKCRPMSPSAAALGDIGRHFPDSDPRYRNADSRVFLREVGGKIREAGFSIANVDATIIAEAPKMAVHIPTMVANLAAY